MSIRIIWQNEVSGQTRHASVAFLNAELRLTLVGDVIVDASWYVSTNHPLEQSEFVEKARAYLLNPTTNQLEVHLLKQGTAYSQKVWQALLDIPFGQVISYSALAGKLGSGPRAVAQACRNNPYAGLIPCHRVVAKAGIGGFMGQSSGPMLQLKQQLLAYERSMAEKAL